ncbi:MAG: sulfatase, partial [Anaerolineae bacterium]|nr:sulfatase [Anaerolineae bacterium]
NPTCSPSRASLLTGAYPHTNGMLGLAHRGFSLYDYSQHIVHTLRAAGYVTALAGVQHIAEDRAGIPAWKTIGYDQFLGYPYTAHRNAVAFLENPPQQPFFLSVGFMETHREFPPLDEIEEDPRYCLPPAPLPDTPETRQDMARFKANARFLDNKMGQVFEALDRTGLAENTLVICTTDHGIAFPRMKCTLTDDGIGVMLMMRGPGGFSGGRVVDALTTHLDLFPTICDVLGIDSPPWLQGRTLLPLVQGEVAALHETIYAEVNYHAAYEPQRAARTSRWKYIRRYDPRRGPVLPNCDDGESKALWMSHGWAERAPEEEALFDLVFDPHEAHNLAGDPAHAGVLRALRERLHAWMVETHDPLLAGVVQAPPTVVVNDPNGISPGTPPVPAAQVMGRGFVKVTPERGSVI